MGGGGGGANGIGSESAKTTEKLTFKYIFDVLHA
jgi:hypothetical protein